MEGMEEGGQALNVNNGGERSPKTLLAQGGRRGIYRWGKYGCWKQPVGQFGRVRCRRTRDRTVRRPTRNFRPTTKTCTSIVVWSCAGLVRSTAGWSNLEPNLAGPGAELDSPK
jgi:hypothetical protein